VRKGGEIVSGSIGLFSEPAFDLQSAELWTITHISQVQPRISRL
jgi:hypothetical protein